MEEQINQLVSQYKSDISAKVKSFASFAEIETTTNEYARRMEEVMQQHAFAQLEEPHLENTIECKDGVKADFKGVKKKL